MANATLLYYNNFSNGLGDVKAEFGCRPDMHTVLENFQGKPYVLRHYQAGNQTCIEYDGTTRKHRCMLRHAYQGNYGVDYPNGITMTNTDTGPWWAGISIWNPSTNKSGGWNDDVTYVGGLDIVNSAVSGDPSMYWQGQNVIVDPTNSADRQTVVCPFDTWTNFILYVERSTTTAGRLKLWLNDVLVMDFTGVTQVTYSSPATSYWRTGVYWAEIDRPEDYTQYVANMRIAKGGSDGYALVDPKQAVYSNRHGGAFRYLSNLLY